MFYNKIISGSAKHIDLCWAWDTPRNGPAPEKEEHFATMRNHIIYHGELVNYLTLRMLSTLKFIEKVREWAVNSQIAVHGRLFAIEPNRYLLRCRTCRRELYFSSILRNHGACSTEQFRGQSSVNWPFDASKIDQSNLFHGIKVLTDLPKKPWSSNKEPTQKEESSTTVTQLH